ncbi:MAG: ISNCY family transposase [Gemmatimonadetes bacterium]|nr:ISNCY family transposase [Gemmatimonadota bacterium]
MLRLSRRDRDRLVILRQVDQGILTVSEGARRTRLSLRQFRRLVRRFEAEGDRAVVHRARGRRPNNTISPERRGRAVAQARDPLYRDFGPTLLSEHLARDPAFGVVHPATLRVWLIAEGLWRVRKQGQRHRRQRERRAAVGELVLMDTSEHAWLEARSSEEIALIAMIDDATSRLFARFVPRDTGAANRQMLVDYLRAQGRMGALYVDRASHFKAHFRARERREQDQAEALTLIRRALGALDIELILALSPQAKGRVERLFGTLEDRLVKELRVRGIATLDGANRFLGAEFIPFWNTRFTVSPREPLDAHRALPEGVDLLRLFAETDTRVIRSDFSFRYQRVSYQIEVREADGAMPQSSLTIERRLDGTTRFRWRERYLSPTVLPDALATAARTPSPAPERAAAPVARRGRPIPADHPWRRFPIRVGRGQALPAGRAAPLPSP